jgi:glyoxylase-like metal-dependent hydrolase (beta-lactamase superfamily II)
MYTKQIGRNLYQVELCTGDIEQLICSYILAGSRPALVESGPTNSVPNLLAGIDELGIKRKAIEYVFVTHVHLDHGGGAGTLLKSLPNAKVVVHPRGAPHMVDPDRLWSSSKKVLGYVSDVFGKPEPVPHNRIISKIEGAYDLGDGAILSIIETLGHASHNLSFQETFNGGVFPGDAAGTYLPECGVVVPTTPPPFYLESALDSLDKLIALNPTALYFSHFGKADQAVERLRAYKVQLQLWADVAMAGVTAGKSPAEIRDAIIATDPVMTQNQDFIKNHQIYKKTVLENCVLGFVEYAKARQTEVQP